MLEEAHAHAFFAVSSIASNSRDTKNMPASQQQQGLRQEQRRQQQQGHQQYGSKATTAGTPTRAEATATAGTPTIWQQANNSRDTNKNRDESNSKTPEFLVTSEAEDTSAAVGTGH
jgi:hypothetical protein